jgi:hypothetical protein
MVFYKYLLASLTFGLQKLWGLKIAPPVLSAGNTVYPGMAHGRYEGITIWTPLMPSISTKINTPPLHLTGAAGVRATPLLITRSQLYCQINDIQLRDPAKHLVC